MRFTEMKKNIIKYRQLPLWFRVLDIGTDLAFLAFCAWFLPKVIAELLS